MNRETAAPRALYEVEKQSLSLGCPNLIADFGDPEFDSLKARQQCRVFSRLSTTPIPYPNYHGH